MVTPLSAEDERRRLIDEKKKTEDEYDAIRQMRERGELSEEEFERRRHELERQFVEIMDRIAQMTYLLGE